METVRLIVLIIHILGFAALIGGLLAQAGDDDKRVNSAMRDGVGTAFLAGLVLWGVLEADDVDVNHAKLGTKLLIGLVLLVLVMVNTRKPKIPQGLWIGLLALSVIQVVIAVAWSPVHTS
jgi:heme A synthase